MIDCESLARTWLDDAFPDAKVSTETDTTLGDNLPWIRVERGGGADKQYVIDFPLIDVDVFHSTRILARTLAEQVRDSLILTLPGKVVGPGNVRFAETILAPIWAPWDNTSLRRFTATYKLTVTPA